MKFKIHGSFAKKIKGLRLKVLASDFTQKPGLDCKMQKNVRQPKVLKQITERNAEKCASIEVLKQIMEPNGRKMCVNQRY